MGVRIGIAEDQVMFREGLKKLINSFEGYEVVCDCENGKEMIDLLDHVKIDVALIDYRMPLMNGPETIKSIRKYHSDVKILVLSMYDDDEFVVNCISNGANGYLTKDEKPDEIIKAVESVITNGYYLNDRTSKLLIGQLITDYGIKPNFNKKTDLNDLEKKVIVLVCEELTNKEIADKICKSIRTVEASRTSIMKKIGAKNTAGVVMYAVKNNLVSI